ncbi:MAG: exopolysaccharide Pel transporter PelG [Pseudomonadota bacterium]|jgi:uncharacterized membrane protein
MAGIGFELKKLLKDETWFGLAKTYAYAGVISSGPWVLSILGIMLVGFISISNRGASDEIASFLVSVTYLMSVSLILSSILQLVFTRFIADKLYLEQRTIVLPNLVGALALTTVGSGSVGLVLALLFFRADWVYAALMLVNLVLLCNMWIVLVFVAGMKRYHAVLFAFLGGYIAIVLFALPLHYWGANGLLLAFLLGHVLLTFGLLYLVLQEFDSDELMRLDFLQRKLVHPILIPIGVLFNLGVWIDKWIFWFYPDTSDTVNGILRASVIYDMPIFLAYLSIIPGMASFLMRVETDFVEHYKTYYQAINGGRTLGDIEALRENMVSAIQRAFLEIVKVQGVTLLVFFLMADGIIQWLELSPLYVHLYYVDLLATAVQVLFLATLNVMFYFNLLKLALGMTLWLFLINASLSLLSLWLGPPFYGYGFVLSLLITTVVGMFALSGKLSRLEYLTFMMQR